jgi:hypothetical protein
MSILASSESTREAQSHKQKKPHDSLLTELPHLPQWSIVLPCASHHMSDRTVTTHAACMRVHGIYTAIALFLSPVARTRCAATRCSRSHKTTSGIPLLERHRAGILASVSVFARYADSHSIPPTPSGYLFPVRMY